MVVVDLATLPVYCVTGLSQCSVKMNVGSRHTRPTGNIFHCVCDTNTDADFRQLLDKELERRAHITQPAENTDGIIQPPDSPPVRAAWVPPAFNFPKVLAREDPSDDLDMMNEEDEIIQDAPSYEYDSLNETDANNVDDSITSKIHRENPPEKTDGVTSVKSNTTFTVVKDDKLHKGKENEETFTDGQVFQAKTSSGQEVTTAGNSHASEVQREGSNVRRDDAPEGQSYDKTSFSNKDTKKEKLNPEEQRSLKDVLKTAIKFTKDNGRQMFNLDELKAAFQRPLRIESFRLFILVLLQFTFSCLALVPRLLWVVGCAFASLGQNAYAHIQPSHREFLSSWRRTYFKQWLSLTYSEMATRFLKLSYGTCYFALHLLYTVIRGIPTKERKKEH